MTDLERIKAWLNTYPGHDILSDFSIDYTDQISNNGGIFPSGLVETSRIKDIFGNVFTENQYNFGLYYVFDKSPGDDVGAERNADWIIDFQKWVQEQSIEHKAPTFGDNPNSEKIIAQNGTLYTADDEGTAIYMVQLSVSFEKNYFLGGK